MTEPTVPRIEEADTPFTLDEKRCYMAGKLVVECPHCRHINEYWFDDYYFSYPLCNKARVRSYCCRQETCEKPIKVPLIIVCTVQIATPAQLDEAAKMTESGDE